ncbi:hypothetical protein THRCLA_23210 [Thraustotheca clavata]|uniref:Protein kinase domain-containing protein n=1 Tax=Thraustotheca clavata TaxID=74557 RepID=A0A1V9Y9H9_9STRA|nr:hypothetical protein THRCLA_23210 [Thraustotheca clavata]
MAPEVICGERYKCSADISSMGVVLTEMANLQLPYHELGQINLISLAHSVCDGSYRPKMFIRQPKRSTNSKGTGSNI